jgi:hypothetical protein
MKRTAPKPAKLVFTDALKAMSRRNEEVFQLAEVGLVARLETLARAHVKNATEDDGHLLCGIIFNPIEQWAGDFTLDLYRLETIEEIRTVALTGELPDYPGKLSKGCTIELEMPKKHAVKGHKRKIGNRTVKVKGHSRGRRLKQPQQSPWETMGNW